MPFGIDAVIILLAARHREMFWVFPPIVTVGSLVSAALTYWVGCRAGGAGLSRLVPPQHLERITQQLLKTGVAATAAAAVLPPPFPLTPFLLTCGALDLDRWRFFVVFGVMRFVRFGALALLARQYGEGVMQVLESDRFQVVATAIVVAACVATIASAILLWRRARAQPALGIDDAIAPVQCY